MEKIAIYPGTFDPITKGHIDVIETASSLFDAVYVTLLQNTKKTPMFDLPARRIMIDHVLTRKSFNNVVVRDYKGLTVDCARKIEADFIVRGLRLTTDYEEELNIALNNRVLSNNLVTILIPPKQEHIHISSSAVRELITFGTFERLWQYVDNSTLTFIEKTRKETK